MDGGAIGLIVVGGILWTVILSSFIAGGTADKHGNNSNWWVTPEWLKYSSDLKLNPFGRFVFSFVLWVLDPVWTIICFIRFLLTVGGD